MKNIIVWPLLVSLLMANNGCAGNQKSYTGQQKQQLETATIEGTYDNVFNAVRTVFLNEGLILKQVDKNSGFLLGTMDIAKSRVTGGRCVGSFFILLSAIITFGITLIFLPFLWGHRGYDQYEITATIVEIDQHLIELRLQTPLLEKRSEEYGIALKRIFAEIKKQTMILEAAGRK